MELIRVTSLLPVRLDKYLLELYPALTPGRLNKALRGAVLAAGGTAAAPRAGRAITYADLYAWGLSGTAGSRQERFAFLKRLGLPPRLSKKELLEEFNRLYTFEQLDGLLAQLELLYDKNESQGRPHTGTVPGYSRIVVPVALRPPVRSLVPEPRHLGAGPHRARNGH